MGWTLITKNWKLIAVGLAVIAIYFYWNNLTSTIKEQAQEISQLKADKIVLESAIKSQNEAITKLGEEKKTQDALLKAAEERGRKLRKEADADVQRILQGIKPKTCDGAIQYLIDAATSGEIRL